MSLQPIGGFSGAAFQTSPPVANTAKTASVENTQPVTSVASQKPQAAPSAKELQDAVKEVQKVIEPLAQELQFSIDKDTGKTVVKVMDTSTQKVIRQFPSEEILQMAKSISSLQEKFQGLLVKQEA